MIITHLIHSNLQLIGLLVDMVYRSHRSVWCDTSTKPSSTFQCQGLSLGARELSLWGKEKGTFARVGKIWSSRSKFE